VIEVESYRATGEEGDWGKCGKEIWRRKCRRLFIQVEEDGGSSARQS